MAKISHFFIKNKTNAWQKLKNVIELFSHDELLEIPREERKPWNNRGGEIHVRAHSQHAENENTRGRAGTYTFDQKLLHPHEKACHLTRPHSEYKKGGKRHDDSGDRAYLGHTIGCGNPNKHKNNGKFGKHRTGKGQSWLEHALRRLSSTLKQRQPTTAATRPRPKPTDGPMPTQEVGDLPTPFDDTAGLESTMPSKEQKTSRRVSDRFRRIYY